MTNALFKTLAAGARGIKSLGGLPMGNTLSVGRGNVNGLLFGGLLPGAHKDFDREAGSKWKNAVVAASLGWISRNLPAAPPVIFQEEANGEEKVVPKHPLSEKLRSPNKYYDGKTLRQATFLSLIAGGGNAYWWVKRDNIGRAIELWWLPHWEVWPIWTAQSTTDNWITGYGYRNNGVTYILQNDEVIHFREGMDPQYMRIGLDPLRPVAREIVTDNDAAGFTAALLGNMCIPGCVISPEGDGVIEQSDAQDIKDHIEQDFGGDNRFRPMVIPSSIKIDKLSFSPEEMALTTLQDRGEARMCAIIGINAVVLGFTVGLEHSKYANMKEARAGAWEDGIIPRLENINSTLDTQLLPFYPGSESQRVGADYRRVPALQDSMDDLCQRLTLAVGGPWMSRNEARSQVHLPDVPDGDELYPPKGAGAAGDNEDDPVTDQQVRKMIGVGWQTRQKQSRNGASVNY